MTATRRGPGRPRTPRGASGRSVTVRLSEAEADQIALGAAGAGVSSAEYLRRTALAAAATGDLTIREHGRVAAAAAAIGEDAATWVRRAVLERLG